MIESVHSPVLDNHNFKERDVHERNYGRIHITKIRDSEAGGLHSVKHEEYFHGFLPKEQAYDLLTKVGDFLVRQAVRVEKKSSAPEYFIISVRKNEATEKEKAQEKTEEEMEEEKKQRDENELRHIHIKYSRRAKLYYVRLYGFKWVSGLIEYHRRYRIPLDEDGTIIKKAVKRAEWQLNHEQIVKTKKLGDGAFGDVYKGILRCGLIESKDVAIKTIIGSISSEENEKLFREAMLMKRLVHPNVIMLIGVASNEEPVMIVMEFAQEPQSGGSGVDMVRRNRKLPLPLFKFDSDTITTHIFVRFIIHFNIIQFFHSFHFTGGSVLDAIQAKPGPTIFTRIKYCHGAALGLQYLSEQGIIHRDVAARNCLIGKNDVAKISDFGLSIVGTQKKEKTLKKVPVRYLAPETLKKREYTVKTDVWSFGVFMWEVFHDGKEPYAEMNAKEVRKYVLSGNTLDNESDHYPQHMWSITVSCFAHDPQSRPRFDSIAAQIWTGIDEFKEHDKMLSMIKFW
ncbi:hypothetical protein RB195_015033 [Necator americanus]|uniref:Tyrosine-protein kinase n=1 Tax=Necator americanus TaxID=51031 RepID=A0ABR1E4G0_NECAM